MLGRPAFVEPLVRTGLDFYDKSGRILAVWCCTPEFYGPEAVVIQRIMLSRGVYDGLQDECPWWVAKQMLGHAEVFDSMLANVLPDFYQWPLTKRVSLLDNWVGADIRLVGRFLHRDGRLRINDLRRPMPGYRLPFRKIETILDLLTAIYFTTRCHHWHRNSDNKEEYVSIKGLWNHTRRYFRDILAMADYNDLSPPHHDGAKTLLYKAMGSVRRRISYQGIYQDAWTFNTREHRGARRDVQCIVREWLEDLQTGGKDLVVYGRAEHASFLRHGPSRWYRLPGCNWSGFTFGPRPEDWNLMWEWDPDVEGLVGDFWQLVENPLLVVPGSWVDDDDGYQSDHDVDDFCW